jgi:hypothetical protein
LNNGRLADCPGQDIGEAVAGIEARGIPPFAEVAKAFDYEFRGDGDEHIVGGQFSDAASVRKNISLPKNRVRGRLQS